MLSNSILPFVKGCGTGAGLLMAIGAQNAFVLKQGILKSHVFAVALFCALSDAVLISLGVGGLGQLIISVPYLLDIMKYAGAVFLIYYGFRAFKSAFRNQKTLEIDASCQQHPTLQVTLVTLLALTFLNPHVYFDTVVLLGSIGAQFEDSDRAFFAVGAILTSFIWFFTLAYGAAYLAPFFKKAISWRILDACVGIIMWGIALSLLWPQQTCS